MFFVPWWKRIITIAVFALDRAILALYGHLDATLFSKGAPNLFCLFFGVRHTSAALRSFSGDCSAILMRCNPDILFISCHITSLLDKYCYDIGVLIECITMTT